MSSSPPPPLPSPLPRDEEGWASEDKGAQILWTCWVITAISTVFIACRLFVRGAINRRLRSDDYTIVFAQVCGYISTALSTVAVRYGNGKHFELLTVEQKEGAIMYTIAGFCPGVLSFGIPKIAAIILLTRLLHPTRFHWWCLWIIGILSQLVLLATVGILLGQCMPARALWDFDITEKTCIDKQILVGYCIFAGAFSAFVDIYLALYPAAVLFNLQLPFRKKLILSGALGLGLISGIVAIYKSTRIPSLGSADFSYDTSDLVIWTVIEGSTIMIATSIPLLQPLVELVAGRDTLTGQRRKWHRYMDGGNYQKSTDVPGSSVELGGSRSAPRRRPMYPNLDVTAFDATESREEILEQPSSYLPKSTKSQACDVETSPTSGQPVKKGRIVRTDVVRVSYD